MNNPLNSSIGMTRRERLMAAIRGLTVDHVPVSFYELNAVDQYPDLLDPFNVYSGPNWEALLRLTAERSARILMRSPSILGSHNPITDLCKSVEWKDANGSRYQRSTITYGRKVLTRVSRQDPDIDTIWIIEHYLKNSDDLKTWLELPKPLIGSWVDCAGVHADEVKLGDAGIVMIDIGDPLCAAAGLFEMAAFMVIAYQEQALFHRLLDWFAEGVWQRTELIARSLPDHLWRIPGPEYASPPYLPPRLFHDYVVAYDRPMVDSIQKYGGTARLHSHGRLHSILDEIMTTGCKGLDPLEPPPQGDMELAEIRRRCGEEITLFGNIEISDIETLPESDFRRRVEQALRDGPSKNGSHFVLMPTACPLGRELSPKTLRNYEVMIEMAEGYGN